jgi:soluble lytic murein transglycosylase-like protein
MDALRRISEIQQHVSSLRQAVGRPSFAPALATASGAIGTSQIFGQGLYSASTRSSLAPRTLQIPQSVDLPDRADAWLGEIEAAAGEAGVPASLLTALVWSESAFREGAVSHAGAIGLAQLMPGTASQLGVDPHDPSENLRGGARYLAAQLDRFGSVELALAAYNAGPGRVSRAGGIPNIPETQNYVEIVTRRYRALEGETP